MSTLHDFLQKPWVSGALAGTLAGALSAAVILIFVTPLSHQVITSLSQLAWPLVVLLIVYWLKDVIRDFISRFRKGKVHGVELECDAHSTALIQQASSVNRTELLPPNQRSPMQQKILKTLWTKQVNRFPKYDGAWSFRVYPWGEEFLEFREAGGKLLAEGLVGETADGQLYLTKEGFEFCKRRHQQFDSRVVEWWPEEPLEPEKLKLALE